MPAQAVDTGSVVRDEGPDGPDEATAKTPASPLAVLGAIAGCLAPVVLGLLFASAYGSIDRQEPDVEGARRLHLAVITVGALIVVGGILLALRTMPILAVGLILFPLGFALEATATSYSHTECVSGFWTADCDTWGDQEGRLMTWAWLGFLLAAGGGALMLLAGRAWALGFALSVGLGLAAAYVTASVRLLPKLADEAARAAESNAPIVHDTPGIPAMLLVAALAAAAVWRRSRA